MKFGDVYCITPRRLYMTCRGFAWTICFSWYSRLYLIDRACPYRSYRYPLCWYKSIGSWLLYIFHLPCNIIIYTLMNLQSQIHIHFHFMNSYILNWCVGVDLFALYCHKLDLFLIEWAWRLSLVEIFFASTSASSLWFYLAYKPSRFNLFSHSSLPSTSKKILPRTVMIQHRLTLIKGQQLP